MSPPMSAFVPMDGPGMIVLLQSAPMPVPTERFVSVQILATVFLDTLEQTVMYQPALKAASMAGAVQHQIPVRALPGGLIRIVRRPYASKPAATVGTVHCPTPVRVQPNGRVMIAVFRCVIKLVSTELTASPPTRVNVQQAGQAMIVVFRSALKASLNLILQHTCTRRVDRGLGISTFRARLKSGVSQRMNSIASRKNVR